MRKFEVLKPKRLEEAYAYLESLGPDGIPLAGGTDVIPSIKDNLITPRFLINLNSVNGLSGINDNGDHVTIGALTTLSDVVESQILAEKLPVLRQAAAQMASVHIRNIGTIGGNLCNASPSADMAPSLLVLNARVRIGSLSGAKEVALEDFFTGPGKTCLEPGELLNEIIIPRMNLNSRAVYLKYSLRKAMDLATVGVAVKIKVNTNEKIIEDCKIALGAVAPVPFRAKKAEAKIIGQKIKNEIIIKAADEAAKEARPIDDIRSSAAYRCKMVRVFVKRALEQVLEGDLN